MTSRTDSCAGRTSSTHDFQLSEKKKTAYIHSWLLNQYNLVIRIVKAEAVLQSYLRKQERYVSVENSNWKYFHDRNTFHISWENSPLLQRQYCKNKVKGLSIK